MNDFARQRSRLQIGAYLLLFTMALLFFMLSIYTFSSQSDGTWKDLFLGLSGNFMTAFIIFAVLRFFLSNPDDQVLERLERALESRNNPMDFQTDEHEAYNQLFHNLPSNRVTDVCLIGYSMAHLLQERRETFREIVAAGARIRILLLDPYSSAGKLMTEKVGNFSMVEEPHLRSMRYITSIVQNLPDSGSSQANVEVRKLPWVPSCALVMIQSDRAGFRLLVGVNGFVVDNTIPRRFYSVTNEVSKSPQYLFFEEHFEREWASCKDGMIPLQVGLPS